MFIVGLVGVIVLDQITKIIAQQFHLSVLNQGISFSWLTQVPQGVLLVAMGTVGLGIGWYLIRTRQRYPLWAGLFLGGMLSNGLDRLLLGGVRDWFTIPFTHITNNLADVAISIGMMGIVWATMKEHNNV